MSHLNIKGKAIYYQHHAAVANSSNLILVHGAGGTHHNWPAELRALPNANVFSLDLPGHGRSSPPAHQSINGYADDLMEFIRALDLQSVIICGHSMGGAIAVTVALHSPPELRGLILVGTGARLRVSELILDQVRQDYPNAVSTILQYAWAEGTPVDLIALDHQNKLQADPQVVLGDFQACNNFDAMARISEIRYPTLVISGTADRLTPEKYGIYLANHIDQAQFVCINGGGHMMALEQPGPVVVAIQKFLEELSLSNWLKH